MKKKMFITVIGTVMAAAILAGCGGSSAKDTSYTEEAAADAYAYSDDLYATGSAADAEMAVEENTAAEETMEVSNNRKLIKNVNMNVETEEFDKLVANVENKITALNGYAESKDIGGRSYYDSTGSRYANITARIPSNRLDEFVSAVAEQSNVTSKSESVDDVTLQYVDIEAHTDSLRTEQKRLNELLDQAVDLDTIIALEERLTEVRYQLESYESQLRTMDNQVDYSTVYLYISEVERLTPQTVKSPWERMTTGFAESTYKVAKGLQEFGIGFVIALPFLFVFAVIIAIVVGIVILIVKCSEKQYKKKQQKKIQQKNPQQKNPQAGADRPQTEQVTKK